MIFNFNFLKKRTCKHEWKLTEYSNVLQCDDMGYPLRLCIFECRKCGVSEHRWIDVPLPALNELDTGESVLLKWTKVN